MGGSLATRMTGAHEAIQAIVSDPALKSTVNFGFGYWSSEWRGPAKWFTGWNNRQDKAKPCTKNNCLRVKVNEQGADKIYRIVKNVSPRGGEQMLQYGQEWHLNITRLVLKRLPNGDNLSPKPTRPLTVKKVILL